MSEYYVELQDASGTAYGTTDPWTDDALYFEDLDEAKMYAKMYVKNKLNGQYILARVIESGSGRVIDFFQR